jgi:hypothetical protein
MTARGISPDALGRGVEVRCRRCGKGGCAGEWWDLVCDEAERNARAHLARWVASNVTVNAAGGNVANTLFPGKRHYVKPRHASFCLDPHGVCMAWSEVSDTLGATA